MTNDLHEQQTLSQIEMAGELNVGENKKKYLQKSSNESVAENKGGC